MFLITFFLFLQMNSSNTITIQDIVFKTKDNLSIYGTFYESTNGKNNLPAILLLHQFGSNRNEWSEYANELASLGYIVLSIDLRGHGQSDTIPDIFSMLNESSAALLDVEEAIHRLKKHPKVNPNKIAIIGGSVGGNLAAAAAGNKLVPLAVCISGKTSAVKNLSGNSTFEFRNTMFVAASQDGDRVAFANEMGKQSIGENEILIDGNSSAHGVAMLKDKRIKQSIYSWIKKHL